MEEDWVIPALESHHATSLQHDYIKAKKVSFNIRSAYFNVEEHARDLKRTSRGGMRSCPIHGIELTN
jgi:hypothetical protein